MKANCFPGKQFLNYRTLSLKFIQEEIKKEIDVYLGLDVFKTKKKVNLYCSYIISLTFESIVKGQANLCHCL